MEDLESSDEEGALPPGEPTQTDLPNDPAAPPELPELVQGDETASGQSELEDPSGDAEALPGQDATPERFVQREPRPLRLPDAVWINPPAAPAKSFENPLSALHY